MAKQFNRKEFQHAVSVLKKKGLVPASVIARYAEPFNIRGGKRLDEIVKKHRAVVEDYDKAHAPRPIETIDLDVPYHNLEQFLRDAMADTERIDEMKRNREYFSFRFYGHKTFQVFENAELMLEELLHYESIEHAINTGSAKDMQELYKNLAIVRVPNKTSWEQAPNKTNRRGKAVVHKATKDYWKKQYAKRKAKLTKGPEWKKEQVRQQNADRQKDYRERLNKKEKAAYKAAARDRADDSRTKKAKAKKKGKKK